jgi:BMFP domain-containing protein YqiC
MRSARKKPNLDQLKLVSDLARMASGAIGSFGGVGGQVKDIVREKLDHLLDSMDLVSRAEFDRVEALAVRAREQQEELEERLAVLEAKAGVKKSKKKTAAKKKPAKGKKK